MQFTGYWVILVTWKGSFAVSDDFVNQKNYSFSRLIGKHPIHLPFQEEEKGVCASHNFHNCATQINVKMISNGKYLVLQTYYKIWQEWYNLSVIY